LPLNNASQKIKNSIGTFLDISSILIHFGKKARIKHGRGFLLAIQAL
jgi:hypothetical protein